MGKMPYIPVYIGDWEQDLNCVSLEAEGAALKLVFKLWKSSTRGLLSFCFSDLTFLFKKSDHETRKIIAELRRNGIFNFKDLNENEIEISSRRMLREVELSRVRSESGSEGGRGKKKDKKQTKSKTKPNANQIPEYEGDVGNENDISSGTQGGAGGRSVTPPSLAMVERPFIENGLTAADAEEFFNEVEGRAGWKNINNWKVYTEAAIVKRLNKKQNGTTGNNPNRNFAGNKRDSLDSLEKLAKQIIRESSGSNG